MMSILLNLDTYMKDRVEGDKITVSNASCVGLYENRNPEIWNAYICTHDILFLFLKKITSRTQVLPTGWTTKYTSHRLP